uniref:DNA polymerase theta-like n=1 Tax=Myxine glutinosa TaxID=7769 RepID=UPI00358F608A
MKRLTQTWRQKKEPHKPSSKTKSVFVTENAFLDAHRVCSPASPRRSARLIARQTGNSHSTPSPLSLHSKIDNLSSTNISGSRENAEYPQQGIKHVEKLPDDKNLTKKSKDFIIQPTRVFSLEIEEPFDEASPDTVTPTTKTYDHVQLSDPLHDSALNVVFTSKLSTLKVHSNEDNASEEGLLPHPPDIRQASPHEATMVADPLELSEWGMPPVVLEAYKASGISQLFPWQAECLTQSDALLGKNLVYSAPTSAGKTLVAEILVLKHLLEKHRKALITLPYVALAREKTHRLKNVWQGAGIRVGGFMGNESPPGGLAACDVAVCTIERANGLLNRLLEDGQLNLLGVIVVDELHMVAEPGRGALLELMLAKILYLTSSLRKYKPIQIIGMSATLPDLRLLASWLRADFFHTDFRPVPLCEYIKVGRRLFNADMELIREIESSLKGDTDLVQQLCHETVRAGHSVLAFCPSKQWCEALARAVAHAFQQSPQGIPVFLSDRQNLMHELQQAGTTIDPVLSCTVPQGVAFHHAGLTMGERAVLEEAFRRGHLSVLVATTTLASGVNLPARRVLVRSPRALGRPLSTLTYQQMAGRAGRFGLDMQGESILVCSENEQVLGRSLLRGVTPSLRSTLQERLQGGSIAAITRAMLEIIVSGVAKTADDACCYTSCTLLSTCFDNKELSSSPAQCAKQKVNEDTKLEEAQEHKIQLEKLIEDSLNYLVKQEFVHATVNKTGVHHYIGSLLGKAALAAGLPPSLALAVFADLQRALRCLALDSDLHLLYLDGTEVVHYRSDIWCIFDLLAQ